MVEKVERKDAKGEQLDDEADVRRETQRDRETERATSNDERREFAQGEWVGGWQLTTCKQRIPHPAKKEWPCATTREEENCIVFVSYIYTN